VSESDGIKAEVTGTDSAEWLEFATGVEVEKDEPLPGDSITEPFDPTLIRVETKPGTIDLLVSRMSHQEIEMAPDFQRKGGIWSDGAQSRLIESLLIRVPLPAFYMDATNEDKWIVVDGLQRLTTLDRFIIKKNLRLTGLEFLKDYKGRKFDELPRNFQRRILETQVTVYLIERGTPAEVKFNIFKRINTGGLPLSAQEIRHALNQGQVTKFLSKLAGSQEFLLATDRGIRDDRMADRECVLRFLAFTIVPYTEYKAKDLDSFLNDCMAEINRMPKVELDNLEAKFLQAMALADAVFGKYAFRKMRSATGPRYPINKALFESWSVNLSTLSGAEVSILSERKDLLRSRFIELMNSDREFDEAVSQGTGDVRKVKRRFSAIAALIRGVVSW
jgi:hypothetical protein